MRRALALALLLSCHAPAPAPARAPAPVAVQATKSGMQASGLGFDVFVPATWWLVPGAGATLTSPSRRTVLSVRVLDAESTDRAVALAWSQVHSGLSPVVTRREENDLGDTHYDERTEYEYATPPAEHRVLQALAKRQGRRTLVLLAEGPAEEIAAHGAYLTQILDTLDLPGALPPPEHLADLQARDLDAAMLRDLDAFAAQAVAASGVPGASVVVVQGDRIVFEKGYGTKRAHEAAPVAPSTRFLIGSCTKSMTTLLMATRVDEGVFGWDTPVVDVMPSFRVGDASGGKAYRMRDTVCACTGLPRSDLPTIFQFEGHRAPELFADLAALRPTTGYRETYQYSNQMVAAGGFVTAYSFEPKADLVDAYARAMQAKIFGPLGMTRSTLGLEEGARDPDHADPHGTALDGSALALPMRAERFLMPFGPSGGAWSTAHDLGLYMLEELHRGKNAAGRQVVSAAQVEARWVPQVKAGTSDWYALGWGVGDDRGLRIVDHSGATLGFESRITFYPDRALGIAVLANGHLHVSLGGLLRRRVVELAFGARPRAAAMLARAALDDTHEVQQRVAKSPPQPDARWAAALVGTYTHRAYGPFRVRIEGARVIGDAGEWTSELAQRAREPGQPAQVVFAGPILTGLPLEIDGRDLVLDTGSARERFVRQ